MNKDFYNEYYYLERNNWWFKVRTNIIIEEIRRSFHTQNKKNIQVLNVGAATGHSSKRLEEFGSVTSIEYDIDCFNFTKANLNINIINASATALPFGDNQFDIVCAFDVIEHIEDDTLAVKEMARVCKKDGMMYITVPAFMSLWSTHDEINHHYRRYLKSNLKPLFSKLGGKIIYQTYFCTMLFIPLYIFRSTSRMFKLKWLRKGAGSDLTIISKQGLMDKILFQIFNIERIWLKKYTFSFGSSILLSWQKENIV